MKFHKLVLLFCILAVAFIADLCLGTVYIKPEVILNSIFNASDSNVESYIVLQMRLPRAIMAIIAGAGLAVAGLLMQTLFRNALAGPFVLGISSGAGLGVALAVMGSTALGIANLSQVSIIIPSILGSLMVLSLIAMLSMRIKDTMGLLIVGIMLGSLSSAVVGVLSYFSTSDDLKRYIFWSLGSLGNVSWTSIAILTIIFSFSLVLTFLLAKPLNALLLGEAYAQSIGVHILKMRWSIIIITSLLAGCITAFAGPIAFIGLAVPHIARMLISTVNHKKLLPVTMLLGAILLLVCDIIAQVPFLNVSLPINAVTSLLGAPLVIWLILQKRNLNF